MDSHQIKKGIFYGQFDTDRAIAKYFPDDYMGTCIEVGMGDPITYSNTYHFEQIGWKCLCIEPNPKFCTEARGIRSRVEQLACSNYDADNVEFEIFTIHGAQTAVSGLAPDARLIQQFASAINNVEKISISVRTLDNVLSKHPDITSIDFVSIDTENTELDVLKGFDIERWRPKLVILENNFDEPFIADYLKKFSYERVERVGVNDIFMYTKPKGIFYNSGKSVCSIWEAGFMSYNALKQSTLFDLDYTEEQQLKEGHYDFAIFNYHFGINTWCTADILRQCKGINFCLVLEVSLQGNPISHIPSFFSHYLVLDPTVEDAENYFGFPRPLENITCDPYVEPEHPIIGSFGFATDGKEWHKIVEQTQNEFDNALIRINIPPATYVPDNESRFAIIEEQCRSVLHKPGIKLEITHKIMTKEELVQWCGENTLNCFLYRRDHFFATGLAAVTDQAVAARRPLLVSNDRAFRHITKYITPHPTSTIRQAMENKEKVEQMAEDWSTDKFYRKFEQILFKLMKK